MFGTCGKNVGVTGRCSSLLRSFVGGSTGICSRSGGGLRSGPGGGPTTCVRDSGTSGRSMEHSENGGPSGHNGKGTTTGDGTPTSLTNEVFLKVLLIVLIINVIYISMVSVCNCDFIRNSPIFGLARRGCSRGRASFVCNRGRGNRRIRLAELRNRRGEV